MDAKLKWKWVEALRSGKYEQAQQELTDGQGFCCIGVGLLLTGRNVEEFQDEHASDDPTEIAAQVMGLTDEQCKTLVLMNDDEHRQFPEIAKWIEKNIPVAQGNCGGGER